MQPPLEDCVSLDRYIQLSNSRAAVEGQIFPPLLAEPIAIANRGESGRPSADHAPAAIVLDGRGQQWKIFLSRFHARGSDGSAGRMGGDRYSRYFPPGS